MKLHLILWMVAASAGVPTHAADDVVFATFDEQDFQGWQVEGNAFGTGPSQGPWPGQYRTLGFRGTGLANSTFGGDTSTGRLRSPQFTIAHPTISFLIGGGDNGYRTRIDLIVDGKVVRMSTGPNRRTVGRDELEPDHWNVSEFIGHPARIELVDEAIEGPWGHVLVDHIVFETQPRAPMALDAVHTIDANRKYLRIPIDNDLPKRRVTISVDGVPTHYFQLQLANREPTWWATIDISAHHGKSLMIKVDRLPSDSEALERIELSNDPQPAPTYAEPLRPQIHFSPGRGWMNDPNGLFFYKGTFHVFFQHNPYGILAENKHWGHAVSADLIHWKEIGEAIAPDATWGIWSGSGIVDWKNSSQLGDGEKPPIVLVYTSGGPTTNQEIAFSNDKGTTFTKWKGNPIIPEIRTGNRDPKVIWHEPTQHWVMALYVGLKGDGPQNPGQTIHFLSSVDLKEWKVESYIEGYWECPDLFELCVDGNPSERKWVVTGAGGEYAIGDFDGKVFTPSTEKLRTFHGRAYYAGQSFSNIPADDGRTIRVHWLRINTPGTNFKHALSIPLEVKLHRTSDGLRMTSYPVRELEALRKEAAIAVVGRELPSGETIQTSDIKGPVDVELDMHVPASAAFDLDIYGTAIHYDADNQQLSCGDVNASVRLDDGRLQLRVLADVTSLELFAQNGLEVIPIAVKTPTDRGDVILRSIKGTVEVKKMTVFPLRSIWNSTD